jgi:hypothetical protein
MRPLRATAAAIARFAWWVASFFRRARAPEAFLTVQTEELPDALDARTVYLVGEGVHLWSVALLCPCGCGETLHMNLLPDARPRWTVTRHADGTVTLDPSVWRRVGCRSHFFLRGGQIDWCRGPAPSGTGGS